MNKIYYEDKTPEDGVRIHGITEYITQTVYIDETLDEFVLAKALRHELTHIYLWETGQQGRSSYNEEEICDIMSVAGPLICKAVDEIMFRLREGLYKHGE
jgi:predicted SprT family Zn-dependent metalloprotease